MWGFRFILSLLILLFIEQKIYSDSGNDIPHIVTLQQTRLQAELERHIRGLVSFREAVVLSGRYEDGLNQQFLLEARERLLPEYEFRGIIEVGVAELREAGENAVVQTKSIQSEQVLVEGNSAPIENAQLSCPVAWRWTRWGDDFVGEEMFVEDYELAIRESAEHKRPYFSKGIQYILDAEGKAIRRGVRVFIPIFKTWRPEQQSAFGGVDFERDYVGTLFATINLDPLLKKFFNDPKRELELELFHGDDVSEVNRVSGFEFQVLGKPRPDPLPASDPPIEWLTQFHLYGVTWTMRSYATENFQMDRAGIPISTFQWLLFLALALVSGFIFYRALCNRFLQSENDGQGGKRELISRSDARWELSKSGWLWTGLVLGVGLILTHFVYAHEREGVLASDQQRFEMQSRQMWHAVETRIEQREHAITLLQQFADRVGQRPFSEWKHLWQEFKDRMALGGSASGLIEFGFGKIVTQDPGSIQLSDLSDEYEIDLSHLRSTLKDNGVVAVPLLSVTSTPGIPSAVGQDLLSADGQQKLALELAERGLRPRISSNFNFKPSLSQERGDFPVFRMFITLNYPLERDETLLIDEGNPAQRAWGFVYGTFSMDLLLAIIFGENDPREIELEIFSGAQADARRRLTAGNDLWDQPFLVGRHPGQHSQIAGYEHFMEDSQYLQHWWIRFYSTDLFHENSALKRINWIWMTGGTLSFCLAGIVFIQAGGRYRAERLAEELGEAKYRLTEFSNAREQACQTIHDQVIQSLYAASIGIKRMVGNAENHAPESASGSMKKLSGQVLDTLQLVTRELRQLSWKMESAINDESPMDSLMKMIQRYRDLMDKKIELRFLSDANQIPEALIPKVAPIIEEAISNAFRHGEASLVEIILEYQNETLDINIKDDGLGFEMSKCTNLGQGLRNMKHRVEAIGGNFNIISNLGVGTELRCCIINTEH